MFDSNLTTLASPGDYRWSSFNHCATGTINYVATDNAGNISTCTRIVIVVAPAILEPTP